ncbi:hypothetical protein U1Q18_038602 [Sarracenia purpurea var. burkii]
MSNTEHPLELKDRHKQQSAARCERCRRATSTKNGGGWCSAGAGMLRIGGGVHGNGAKFGEATVTSGVELGRDLER